MWPNCVIWPYVPDGRISRTILECGGRSLRTRTVERRNNRVIEGPNGCRGGSK
ncbi:hypothetical protein M407DRAFT_246513 [Tulasnella calospora MUT 4182]|uniref:Uncharacterized protein n=1 Tax=Tulasnella calospora MUT 4182 TaxID=1051891 RepID=A0A0C3Q5G7_9AGAM|nr:hypothetical protein M407DRAFT_246513 [Tulasnella calospora MUT 4182]